MYHPREIYNKFTFSFSLFLTGKPCRFAELPSCSGSPFFSTTFITDPKIFCLMWTNDKNGFRPRFINCSKRYRKNQKFNKKGTTFYVRYFSPRKKPNQNIRLTYILPSRTVYRLWVFYIQLTYLLTY